MVEQREALRERVRVRRDVVAEQGQLRVAVAARVVAEDLVVGAVLAHDVEDVLDRAVRRAAASRPAAARRWWGGSGAAARGVSARELRVGRERRRCPACRGRSTAGTGTCVDVAFVVESSRASRVGAVAGSGRRPGPWPRSTRACGARRAPRRRRAPDRSPPACGPPAASARRAQRAGGARPAPSASSPRGAARRARAAAAPPRGAMASALRARAPRARRSAGANTAIGVRARVRDE